jgi:integrase
MLQSLSTLTRSPSTEKSYLDGVNHLVRHLGLEDPDQLVAEIKAGKRDQNTVYKEFLYAQSSSGFAPSTVRVRTSAVAKFLEANDVPVTVKPKQKVFPIYDDVLPSREMLTRAVNAGNLRAKTAILILASSGLRVGELVNLRLADIDTKKNPSPVRIRGAFRQGGKLAGAKERKSRVTFVSDEAKEALDLYLDGRRQQGEKTGKVSPVMVTDKGDPMSGRNLSAILRNAFVVAGATKRGEGTGGRHDLHPHVLRKWFKTQLISSGVPGPIADRLCGHSRYMAREYELYTEEQLAQWYSKAMPNLSFVRKPEVDEDGMKLDTLFLLAKGLGLSETKIGHIKQVLAKSGPITPEAAAELIGKELVAPLKLRASMNSDTEPETGNPGTHGNPGNPGKKNCQAKVITEDEVERYLEAGWEIAATLGNGKIAVKKP